MKLLLLGIATLFTAVAPAAITSWLAGISTSGVDKYANGTAYFLSVPEVGSDFSAIKSYIEQNGLENPDDSTVTLLSSGVLGDDAVFYSGEYSADSWLPSDEANTYYVLLVNKEGTEFILSPGGKLTDTTFFAKVTLPDGTPQYAATFYEGDADWSSAGGGTVGGGTIDPGVPEPTALALLALGVAGVALRRRVA